MHAKGQPETSTGPRRAPSSAQRSGTRAPLSTGFLAPQAIASLQRTMGNAAVARIIRKQREAARPDGQPVQRSLVPEVLRSPGRPLEEPVRAEMEEWLGADFSDVRVHSDDAARRSAAEIGARAYTSGSHVVIGGGGADLPTMVHELTHVIQQRQGPVAGTDHGNGLSLSDPGDRFEREAEANARWAVAGQTGAQKAPEAARKPTAAGSGTAASVSVQRVRLNIRSKDTVKHKAGTISGVSNWASRPPSNLRGTQGQHRTAFVVFQDAVSNRVADRSLAGAAKALKELVEEYLDLPGMAQKNADYLRPGFEECAKALQKAGEEDDAEAIGQQIDKILRLRNQVPGTAERGEGGGRGEAGSSGIVMTVEKRLRNDDWDAAWDGRTVADQVRKELWRLFDYNPGAPKDPDSVRKIATALLTHCLSVRSAYPTVWAWLTREEYYMAGYLAEHRQDDDMPLVKLSDEELAEVVGSVHARL